MKGIKNMIKQTKFLAISFFAFGLLAAPLAVVGTASAQKPTESPQIQNPLCGGVNSLNINASEDCEDATEGSSESLNTLITNVVNIFSVIVGIIAVIMIIVGGFKYITSGGDSGNVTGAKNTILYAIVGLVIVALAQFIVRFVLAKATGAAG